MTFVGVDGEGMTVNGEHRYVLFGVGEEQIENPDGLEWAEIFSFLYARFRPGVCFAGFFLGYDFTQIFRTMPEQKVWALVTTEGRAVRKHRLEGKAPHPVECDGWQFDVLGMKRLRVRPKRCECEFPTCPCDHAPWMYICDVGSFFQASFLSVIDPKGWADGTQVVSQDEYQTILAGKEKRSTAVLDDDMRLYNRLENVVLSRVMRTLDLGFHGIGIHLPPSKWFGPGQAAQAWLKGQNVSSRQDIEDTVPAWFLEAARMSYYGGWFEQFVHGIIPGESHEYDINSAYPAIIATLPCLLHGTYTNGTGIPTCTNDDLCLVFANVWAPSMPDRGNRQYIGSMLHRDSNGRIFRPNATMGWYWYDEILAANRAGMVKRVDNRGLQKIQRWVKYTPCDCPPPMAAIAGLYQKRLDVGKTSPLGKAAKLVYNSGYGKFAQSIGDPIFGNPVYASRITAGTRTMILDAIASHPKGKASVSMVATDAVYFMDGHPNLTISTELGRWDYTRRTSLTLFKPGVYWDDGTRNRIAAGTNPKFKARGFQAADFVRSLSRVDDEYRRWDTMDNGWEWPSVSFATAFSMTTALQAIRRGKWELAGHVDAGVVLEQNADPRTKRQGLYRDEYDGRTIYRTEPYQGLSHSPDGRMDWIPSTPYTKRFGMEDPWSDESHELYGMTPDGYVTDVVSWLLNGK